MIGPGKPEGRHGDVVGVVRDEASELRAGHGHWHTEHAVVFRDGVDRGMAPMATKRITVRVLLLFGDQAEIVADVRQPSAAGRSAIRRQSSLPRSESLSATCRTCG